MVKKRIMSRTLIVFAACLVATISPARAEDRALEDLLGKGIHAYFGGDAFAAHDLLTATIDNGTRDPRAFYFRGLTYLCLGREPDAQADFAKGAQIEMSEVSGYFAINRSLERIQGPVRFMLEQYRTQARLAAYQERERLQYERYERIRRMEPEILQNPSGAAAPATPAPATPPAGAVPPGAAPVSPAAPTSPAAPETPPTDDPFGNPFAEPPANAPATVDPFGT